MATKKTTKTTKKTKKTIRTPKKNIAKDKKLESPYSGLILIASIIILFIIVVPKGKLTNEKTELNTTEPLENTNSNNTDLESITISGNTYVSEAEAYKALRPVPQTRRTREETKFVESYKY